MPTPLNAKERSPREPDLDGLLDEVLDRSRRRRERIRCPRCAWEPDGEAYWGCELCGAVFDTFATRARCPECPNRWTHTWCPGCGRMSRHEDWYVEEDEGDGP